MRIRTVMFALPLLTLSTAGVYLKYFWGEETRYEKLDNIARQYEHGPHFPGLKNNAGPPLSPAPAPAEFKPLEEKYNAQLGGFKYELPHLYINLPNERSGAEIERIVRSLPRLQVGAESMMPGDPKVLTQFNPQQNSDSTEMENASLDISGSYCRIYGIPDTELPPDFRERSIVISTLSGSREVSAPSTRRFGDVFSATFYNSNAAARFTFHEDQDIPARPVFNPRLMHHAFFYVKHFSADLDGAAALIFRHHPDLHFNNLRAALRDDLLREQSFLGEEDLWQDYAACKMVGCPQAKQFAEEAAQHPTGYPSWVWRIASRAKKYALPRQAIGPSQIIIGLAEKASRASAVKDYSAALFPADLADEKALVKTALDPRKSIYLRALVMDDLLAKVKATVFRDPRVMHPADRAPYISNPATAREYGLLDLAYQMLVYPDLDFLAAEIISKSPNGYFTQLYATGRLFDIKLEFPGLFFVSYNYDEGTKYFHYATAAK